MVWALAHVVWDLDSQSPSPWRVLNPLHLPGHQLCRVECVLHNSCWKSERFREAKGQQTGRLIGLCSWVNRVLSREGGSPGGWSLLPKLLVHFVLNIHQIHYMNSFKSSGGGALRSPSLPGQCPCHRKGPTTSPFQAMAHRATCQSLLKELLFNYLVISTLENALSCPKPLANYVPVPKGGDILGN